MNRHKTLIAAAAGAGALSLALALVPAAQADPPAGTYRPLAGGGSDTTQTLMNAIADVVTVNSEKVIASYDAIGTPTVTTKNPVTTPACKDIVRPNGSTAGRDALQASLLANNGCWQFARSSSSKGTYTSSVSMAWVPFATDALTFAVRSDGDVPTQLTKAEIVSIFKCENDSYQPALVQVGSGTRNSWLDYVGIPRDFTPSQYPCLVPVKDGGTFPGDLPQEHDGRELKKNQIMPYSAAVYQAQMWKSAPDRRGMAVVGVIDGVAPTVLNTVFPNLRNVNNIVPSALADDSTSLVYKVFVGVNSEVCKAKTLINLQGFGNLADPSKCGDTSSRS